jgi:hypothetical protein
MPVHAIDHGLNVIFEPDFWQATRLTDIDRVVLG